MSLVISTRCGIGGANPDLPFGNKVEEVTASLDDGVWQVHTWTPAGTTSRPATDAEVAGFEARSAPAAAPDAGELYGLLTSLDAGQRATLASVVAGLLV